MKEKKQDRVNGDDVAVEFMGVNVIPSAVSNPHLRRVIRTRAEGGFQHRYDDHSRRAWSDYSDYSDWSQHKYHERYSEYTDHDQSFYNDAY